MRSRMHSEHFDHFTDPLPTCELCGAELSCDIRATGLDGYEGEMHPEHGHICDACAEGLWREEEEQEEDGRSIG